MACDNNFLAAFIKPPRLFLPAKGTKSRSLGPYTPEQDRASRSPRRFLSLSAAGAFFDADPLFATWGGGYKGVTGCFQRRLYGASEAVLPYKVVHGYAHRKRRLRR